MKTLNFAILILLLALSFVTCGHAADFRSGNAAFERNDYATAFRELLPFAKQGNPSAQFKIGHMYLFGKGVPKDATEGAEWVRKSAEQGDAFAQTVLSALYGLGNGVPKDSKLEMLWKRRAAENGSMVSQENLADMYLSGKGLMRDDEKAIMWYRRSANLGNPSAQEKLGILYYEGQVILKDFAKAAYWLEKAADWGSRFAQSRIGYMYDVGEGVPKDYVTAYKWYNLAAADGDETAKKNRELIEQRMTLVQLAQAQRLARQWKPKPIVEVGQRSKDNTVSGGRNRVVRIQRRLASLGYDPGPTDGILGPKSRTAIRAFQARKGLKVTGTISAGLEHALRSASGSGTSSARTATLSSPKLASTGSGFYVSGAGHILTNEHVVRGCRKLRIPPSVSVAVAAQEKTTDLALLKGPGGGKRAAAKFRGGRGIRSGDDIVVLGYPLRGVLASEVNVTTGTVSALAGPRDDRRFFQITAPVQPGNSGGPVLDRSGNAVGVVRAKLNAVKVARVTGDIPQNVNFAVSAGTVRAFLDAHDVPYETTVSTDKVDTADVAAKARKFTVPIECWK